MNKHLTSEQMDAVLSARGSAETQAHAQNCASCAAEVDGLRQMFGNVRQSAAAVAEKQRDLAARGAYANVRSAWRAPQRVWAMAIAAAVVVSTVTPIELHRRHVISEERERAQAAAVLAQRQQNELADDALLSKVESDLSISVPQPLQPLTVTTTSTGKNNQ